MGCGSSSCASSAPVHPTPSAVPSSAADGGAAGAADGGAAGADDGGAAGAVDGGAADGGERESGREENADAVLEWVEKEALEAEAKTKKAAAAKTMEEAVRAAEKAHAERLERRADAEHKAVLGGAGSGSGVAGSGGSGAADDCGKLCMLPAVLQGMFGGIDLFARSLEALLGGMNDNAVAGLYAEHVTAADADEPFTPQNHPTAGRPTTPKHEFYAVVGADGVDTTAWTLRLDAEPTCDANARVPGRVLESIACFIGCEQARRVRLTYGEVVALRLFTGPMYAKYNEILRVTTLQESAAQPATGIEGTAAVEANTYSTTIGLLISGLIKLGRIATPPPNRRAYRGLADLKLSPAFFTRDEQGFCGVVEPAFLSMSDDEATALRYSGLADGKKAIIFELQLGKASLGAEVEWLSQFPHERERILPPWTHLEVVGTPTVREDGATVVKLRPTVFQNVRTVEEVTRARREEIKAHISGLVTDLRNKVVLADVKDSELDQRLAAFEQDLHARLCKYEPEWYHDNGKYKSTFLGAIREVEDAPSRITDPASALCKQLASMAVSSPVDATGTTDSAKVGGATVGSVRAAGASKPGHGVHSGSGNEVSQLHAKFFQDPSLFQDPSRSFRANLGSDDDFAGGMQGKLGKMPLDYVKSMFLEHNRAHDAQNEFMFGNKGKTSTAQREWRFVVGSQGVNLLTWTFDLDVAEPEYTPEDLLEGRNVKPLRELMQLSMVKKAELRVAEVVGLRLYSGPLFAVYNRVQRGFFKDGDTLYTTTAHLIKSGIFKLAMITAPPPDLTLYRGTGNMALGPEFFKRDAQGCAGGVELSFMSATASRQVALGFAGIEEGKEATMQLPTLYVIHVGKTAIGANIADISQFEKEEEFLYPPLTLLELDKEPVLSPDEEVSEIHVQLTVNQRSTTVEDAEQARRRFLVRHANSLQWSLRNWARQHEGLTQRLGPQIAGVLQRLLDEVHGAELSVLNTNEGYGQVFECTLRIWEEALRQEVVESLWEDGEQQALAGSAKAAVRRFEQAIDAARKLCADSKEVRDRVVDMRRVVMGATGGGEDKKEEADAKFALASDLDQQGAYDEALELYYLAVELYTQVGGQDCPLVVASYNNIGVLYQKKGDLENALLLYQKVLEIRTRVFGSEHLDAANLKTRDNMALLYQQQGRYDQALDIYKSVLETKVRVVGHDHTDVACSHDNIGVVYQKKGDLKNALLHYQKALEVFLAANGQDCPLVANSLTNIGVVYEKKGDLENAFLQHQKALEIRTHVFGSEHPDAAASYQNIGGVYLKKGDLENALLQNQKALEIQTRVFGSEHPFVAASYNNIGLVYGQKGDLENAFLQHQKALEVFLAVHGQEHPHVANSYYNLACFYAARDSTLCRDMLLKAEQTGHLYLLKEHMKIDSDMDAVRELDWYKDLSMRLQM